VGGWNVILDQGIIRTIMESRLAKLPAETGGVLLGSLDQERRIIYVVDTLPTPEDSEERPTWFVRGSAGLPSSVAKAGAMTGGQVEYIGEWHSHPEGHSCAPSATDVNLFGWLTEHMDSIGAPATMLIAGDNDALAAFVGKMAVGELRDEHRTAIVHAAMSSS
jgi:integrative and conjugative element protein (TIGR02256 family)